MALSLPNQLSTRPGEQGSGVSTASDVEALVLGLGIYSTGGGGTVARGREYLHELLASGYEVRWTPVEELASTALTCSTFGMGSIAPNEPMSSEQQDAAGYRGMKFDRPAVRAVQQLSRHLGQNVDAIVPFELGPFNTVIALDAATRLGIPVVDGDYVGRATPELSQALPAVLELSALPAAICDQWGNVLLMLDCPSPGVAEALGKAISTVTKRPDPKGTCAHAAFPLSAADAATAVVDRSLSGALAVGRALLSARQQQSDPVEAIVMAAGGVRLLSGTLRKVEWREGNGYMDGTMVIDCDHEAAAEARIWFRNENHVAWLGEDVIATSPDLITVVSSEDGTPIANSELRTGMRITAVGIASDPRYLHGEPLLLTAPQHYGIEAAYVPLGGEEPDGLVGSR